MLLVVLLWSRRVGTPLAKMTRMWRHKVKVLGLTCWETSSCCRLVRISSLALGQLLGVVLVAVSQPGQGETAYVHRLLVVIDHSAGEDGQGVHNERVLLEQQALAGINCDDQSLVLS